MSADALADGDTSTARKASKAAGAAGGKKPKSLPKKPAAAHRPAAQAVEQEYLNEIHVLGADFVIPADTPAHATHDDPKIWVNEITYRKKKLERIEEHGNFFVAGLGKQNVRIRVSFVMCVHHRSVGPYHGRVAMRVPQAAAKRDVQRVQRTRTLRLSRSIHGIGIRVTKNARTCQSSVIRHAAAAVFR